MSLSKHTDSFIVEVKDGIDDDTKENEWDDNGVEGVDEEDTFMFEELDIV